MTAFAELMVTMAAILSTFSPSAAARDFASRAFRPDLQGQLNSPQAQEQIRKGQALLSAYRAAGADYVNFHWYIADTRALEEAVAYLRARTGLPVITNEVGQWTDDPEQTTAVMSKIVQLGLPLAVWFGLDGPKARGLVNMDGSLRPTGQDLHGRPLSLTVQPGLAPDAAPLALAVQGKWRSWRRRRTICSLNPPLQVAAAHGPGLTKVGAERSCSRPPARSPVRQ